MMDASRRGLTLAARRLSVKSVARLKDAANRSMHVESTASVQLRRALLSDAEEIAVLWHDSWHAGHAGLRQVKSHLLEDRTRESFREHTSTLLQEGEHIVAIDELGGLSGFASVTGAEISQLFVEPPRFRNGIGAMLLAEAEASIAAATDEGSVLATVLALEANERACRFYLKHGWVAAGRVETKIETTLKRPGALHAVLVSHPWRSLRFEKRLVRGRQSNP